MSSIPITESIGNARWMQGDDNEAFLEIRIPATLPEGVRPRNLSVELKDGDVLCVSHKNTRILQWRLFAQVNNEIEWRIEDDTTLVVDLEKRNPVTWSCLLNLPMKANDELFTSLEEINNMFATQLPSLPPTDDSKTFRTKEEKLAKKDSELNKEEEEEKKLLEEILQNYKEFTGKDDKETNMKQSIEEQEKKLEQEKEKENFVKKSVESKDDMGEQNANIESGIENGKIASSDNVDKSLITNQCEGESNSKTATSECADNVGNSQNCADNRNEVSENITPLTTQNEESSNNVEMADNAAEKGTKIMQNELTNEATQNDEQMKQQELKEQLEEEEEAKIVEAEIPNETVCAQEVIKPIGLQDEAKESAEGKYETTERADHLIKKTNISDDQNSGNEKNINANNDGDDDDDDKEMQETFAEYVKSELANYELEEGEITKKLNEIELELVGGAVENEALETAQKKKDILEEMLRVHNELRELRTKPYTLDTFLQATELDLHKARVNLGEWSDEHTEEYANESERIMTATELMTRGLEELQEQNITATIHYLRLAAIHHQHEESTLLLYAVCSRCGLPGGASLLFRRALDKVNPSAACNHKLGELYDQGARYFMPVFPAAIYFYERAAKLGNVNAMLALAQLWCRGSTASSLLTEKRSDAQINTRKYHGWLDSAVNRGSGSAYFVKGCLHLHGEHGVKRSYEMAKDYFDAARKALPEIMRRTQVVLPLLEQLRLEEAKEQDALESNEENENLSSVTKAVNGESDARTTHSVDDGNATKSVTVNGQALATTHTMANGARVMKENTATQKNGAKVSVDKNGTNSHAFSNETKEEEVGELVNRAQGTAMTASKARLQTLTNRGSNVAGKEANRLAPVRRGRKGGMLSSTSAARKAMWEKLCVTSITVYGLYAILFPIRVIMLPYFYSLISGFVESIPWLANSNADLSAFYEESD